MNEAIDNFNALARGESSIKVDAVVPNSELIKIGAVLFASYMLAIVVTALILRR